MQEAAKTFTYTARNGAFLSVLAFFAFLMLVEGGAIVLIINVLVHNGLLRIIVQSIFAVLILFLVFARLLTALWTKHRLTGTTLHLHFGFALKVALPRSALLAAQPVNEQLTMFQPLRANYDPRKHRITAAFSNQGQILLYLKQPLSIKIERAAHPTRTILINVDKRADFLTALHLPALPTSTIELPEQASIEQDMYKEITVQTAGMVSKIYGEPLPRPTGEQIAIRVEGLTRRFGGFLVVDDLYMNIQAGEIYGFLGSNGAGKTTTIRMLVGLLQPDQGRVWIADHDMWKEPVAARTACGYVADRSLLYERLTGYEFLSFLGQLRGLSQQVAGERITHLLAMLDLTEQADRLCGSYSFGMKRKLSLAGALLHQPQVLILDEPLNGLDPRSSRRVKDLLVELAADGVTILLSTHDLATAETICHRVGILHKGRLLAEGSASELRSIAAEADLETVFLNLTGQEVSA